MGWATAVQAELLGCCKLIECVLCLAKGDQLTDDCLRMPSWVWDVIEID